MPELPEVETVMQGLKKAISGAVIEDVLLRRKDLRIPFPANLKKELVGARIIRLSRRAKYLLMELDSGRVIIAHLGMSGTFQLKRGVEKNFRTHDHLVLYLSNDYTLLYHDPRRFGLITLCDKDKLNHHKLLKDLGPEPLDESFDATYLKQALSGKSAPIKNVIMDQHVVVGVGNIYASEALFLSHIHPARSAKSISATELRALVKAIKTVLKAAIKSGGSTLRDYVRSSGDAGYFQHHFNVYDRAGDPCFTCKTMIESIRQGGRATYFCPGCQKK